MRLLRLSIWISVLSLLVFNQYLNIKEKEDILDSYYKQASKIEKLHKSTKDLATEIGRLDKNSLETEADLEILRNVDKVNKKETHKLLRIIDNKRSLGFQRISKKLMDLQEDEANLAKEIRKAVHKVEKLSTDVPKEVSKHVASFEILRFNRARYGTGFHMKYKGSTFIITNAHVCRAGIDYGKNKNYIEVNGRIQKIIKIWKKHDLCAVESWRTSGLELAPSAPSFLDKVIVVGHPKGRKLMVSEGRIVSTMPASIRDGNSIVIRIGTYVSAKIYPGNSGSPLTNKEGKVVGVMFAGSPEYLFDMSSNIAVPYKYLVEFLNILSDNQLSK